MKDTKHTSLFPKSISQKIQHKLTTSPTKYSFPTLNSLFQYSSTLTSIGSFIYDDVHPFLICLYFLHRFKPSKETILCLLKIKQIMESKECGNYTSNNIYKEDNGDNGDKGIIDRSNTNVYNTYTSNTSLDTPKTSPYISPVNKYTLILLLFYIKLSNQPININIFLNDYRKITVINCSNKKDVKYLDEIVYELLTEDWVLDIPVGGC
ncbi:hypothetical protein CWI36_0514p0010 [Hamiltosporidium magnivora]|uniref:Pre-mRNA-splicing factor 38 n=1 Tax=Hamiltosporidium magnivora TaxID=148818 RepID=A0A4Q9LDQ0_9MICR|nr:hypothetical protein CWI36_0514p0010 [Hamiltosporidium magnivora]